MTEKVNKTTTARIEEKLDTVAENIINLENTAKHLEMIKNGFSNDVKKAQELELKINVDNLRNLQSEHISNVKAVNEEHLTDIKEKNKYQKYVFYYCAIQLVVTILLTSLTIHFQSKIKKDRQSINTYYQSFIRDNSLEKTYIKWRESK